jgi:AraC-like DNA-binding protein
VRANRAKIFFWGARALYLGGAFGLEPHRNAVAVLCTGLTEPFAVAVDLDDRNAGYTQHRMVLIAANTRHHLRIGAGTMAFLYVDTQSTDHDRLLQCASTANEKMAHGFPMETQYIAVLEKLATGQPWPRIKMEIATTLGLEQPSRRDERIADALRRMRQDPGGNHDLGHLARQACLSPSRFQHLFKEATGVAVRRYRLWNRMGCAVREIAAGQSLTDAAFQSGFSSAAHFSSAFREMFGMPPSRLIDTQLQIEESSTRPP